MIEDFEIQKQKLLEYKTQSIEKRHRTFNPVELSAIDAEIRAYVIGVESIIALQYRYQEVHCESTHQL